MSNNSKATEYAHAVALYDSGRFDEAYEKFSLLQNPPIRDSAAYLGDLIIRLPNHRDQIPLARELLIEYVGNNPDNLVARRKLAILLNHFTKEHLLAASNYAILVKSGQWEWAYSIGMIIEKNGTSTESARNFGIEHNPRFYYEIGAGHYHIWSTVALKRLNRGKSALAFADYYLERFIVAPCRLFRIYLLKGDERRLQT
jgi:tetratricopeptide (TPR) repeat protein